MSPTATASRASAGAGRRTRFAPRWLVLTHRYLGVAIGALMLLWCLSGFVMLGVHWPEVSRAERFAGLAPIEAARCCKLAAAAPDNLPVGAAAIESVGERPVLRLTSADGERRVIDLSTGEPLAPLDRAQAIAVAQGYAHANPVASADLIDRDQWTVTGEFNRQRPLWRLRLSDDAATDLYVSARTGELVQRTTAAGRILNWLGPIPHWLYPAILRQDAKLWTQVVVWTSLAGVFLTGGGLYLGIVAWRPRERQLTPFRGLMAWHHLGSLAAGLLTLTWVASGLVSMNPWGFLESPPDPGAERLAGPAPPWQRASAALAAAAAARPGAHRLQLAPLAGQVFVMADEARLDAGGRPAPLAFAELARAADALGPVRAQDLITTGDAYYFSHHSAVRLPAWRAITTDGRRYYLDPASGQLLASVDGAARGFRWLHLGLHRLDFVRGLDDGPAWAAMVGLLLSGVTLGVGAGVWLAARRIFHDVSALRRPTAKLSKAAPR